MIIEEHNGYFTFIGAETNNELVKRPTIGSGVLDYVVNFENTGGVVNTTLDASGVMVNREKGYTHFVQEHLEATAKAEGYDSMLSAVSYAHTTGRYQTKGKSLNTLRNNVWDYCNDEITKVYTGERVAPTVTELIAELPIV